MIKPRRKTLTCKIGNVLMGGDHPVVVQSMTSTPTADVAATVTQIKELHDAGSELVRLTLNDFEAMAAVPEIVERLHKLGCDVPLIGDFHFNGHILLEKYPKSAKLLAKYRINPGNVGRGDKHDDNFATMVNLAIKYDKPVRIGVNWGSLDQELFTKLMDENAQLVDPLSYKEVIYKAMKLSALESAKFAENLGLAKDKIVLSVKMSELQDMVTVYERLAEESDYVLHMGLTEAGSSTQGVCASSAALGILLQQGIGDTLRMSLTPEPGLPRSLEVVGCRTLLQSMGIRYFMPKVTSCPGCGRTNSDKFVYLAKDVTAYIEQNMPRWKQKYQGVEKLSVAVMGCVVNGPGESKYADLGISLPGSSEKPSIPIFKDGKLFKTLKGDSTTVTQDFIQLLESYIVEKYDVATPA